MNVPEILDRIRRLQVLVLGDVCLDRWCYYDPSAAEPSRETGIPRIGVTRVELTPGAGGTIANNLTALGVQSVNVLAAFGEDGFGYELVRALSARGISSELAVRSPRISTFAYTKLINLATGIEDRPRVDYINTTPLPLEVEEQVLDRLDHWITHFDVILVSDQAETEAGGLVTSSVRDKVQTLARHNPERVFWVDSRIRSELFRHVVLKPNGQEADEACRRRFGTIDYQRLLKENELRLLVVTAGDEGAKVLDHSGEHWVPARRVEAVDICGAGDSFSAAAATGLGVGASSLEAARFGNLVASITVTKRGTGTASPDEVLAADRQWLAP
jgi:rfaE bifunctional protein kinase chain/domain